MRYRVLSALGVAATIGVAASNGPAAAAGDRGMILGLSCAACHGTAGKSPGAIPAINGKDAAFISEELRKFRSGERTATVMGRIAKGYTDDEIDALAQYFSTAK